jgi:hypothetical protein
MLTVQGYRARVRIVDARERLSAETLSGRRCLSGGPEACRRPLHRLFVRAGLTRTVGLYVVRQRHGQP